MSGNRPAIAAIILLGLLLLSGCTSSKGYYGYVPPEMTERRTFYDNGMAGSYTRLTDLNLGRAFDRLARELYQTDGANGEPADDPDIQETGHTVMVTDFVDIQNFRPDQGGRLMGEMMRASLSRISRCTIIQAEFGQHFRLTDQGLSLLTRNPAQTRSQSYNYPECVVGTYTLTPHKLILFARRVNIHTGSVTRIARRELDL